MVGLQFIACRQLGPPWANSMPWRCRLTATPVATQRVAEYWRTGMGVSWHIATLLNSPGYLCRRGSISSHERLCFGSFDRYAHCGPATIPLAPPTCLRASACSSFRRRHLTIFLKLLVVPCRQIHSSKRSFLARPSLPVFFACLALFGPFRAMAKGAGRRGVQSHGGTPGMSACRARSDLH